MDHESLTRLEVPKAWDARLAGPFAVSMPPVDGVDTAQRFEALFGTRARTAHPSLCYLNSKYPALKEVVDDHSKGGQPPNKLTNDATTNIGLTA